MLDYHDITVSTGVPLPGYLSLNQIETDYIKTRFVIAFRAIFLPHDFHCELLEDTIDGGPNANDMPPSLVTPLSNHYPEYIYDPWHMLCMSCLGGVADGKFWSWWEVHRNLPPVNAPDQRDCWYGLDCKRQRRVEHAAKYNVSSLFDELCLPTVLIDSVSIGAPTGVCNRRDRQQLLPLFLSGSNVAE